MASWPDIDDLVAELWNGDEYVGDVMVKGESFIVTFRLPESGAPTSIGLDELQRTLEEARQALQGPS